ncbi:hypothetical protein THAOC_10010 [Thalassiosira oceanica]|uniref:F-box domain-containing protein n=1 Tax=Thalassiosira oceanica TaxID=159749 RepID=K0T660_THAOC|nr:hypothetical protein THAOC_10010 [Thalassiosira oceanica]|eukprot:EJK68781.1 hypothetical protein THAOC_10010 [Thalassiosira oceanica]
MTSLPKDVIVNCASYLNVQDLGASFALVCRRFRTVHEDAARKSFQEATEEERGQISRYESRPLSLLRELQRLRSPLRFDQILGGGLNCPDDRNRSIVAIQNGHHESTVLSDHVMHTGRHFVTYEFNGWADNDIEIGIVRPMRGLHNQLNSGHNFCPLYNWKRKTRSKISSYRNDSWQNGIIGYLFNASNDYRRIMHRSVGIVHASQRTYRWNDVDRLANNEVSKIESCSISDGHNGYKMVRCLFCWISTGVSFCCINPDKCKGRLFQDFKGLFAGQQL